MNRPDGGICKDTPSHHTMGIYAIAVSPRKLHARYFLIILCILSAFPVFAQKVKKEVILYKKANAVAVGYTCKGWFVNNSPVTIYRLPFSSAYRKKEQGNTVYFKGKHGKKTLSSLGVMADGIYYKANGKACLKGEYHPQPFLIYKGIFSLCNCPDGAGVTADAKKGTPFKFGIVRVDYCHVRDDHNWEIAVSEMDGKYFIRANFLNSDNLETLEGAVPLKEFPIRDFNSYEIFHLLSKIDYAKVRFKNGDSFAGILKIEAQAQAAGNWRISWSGLSSDYKYATGETFKGLWQQISTTGAGEHLSISIPTRGVMTFKDGQSVEGNWLAGFSFTGSEWEKIFDGNRGPTDIRDKAIALREKKDAERREEQRKEAEKRAREQAKLRQEQARKRFLINKYGASTGTLLAEGKIRLGMTKEMVNEVWNQQIYDVTQTVSYGRVIEVWAFNPDKLSLYIAANGDKSAMAVYLFALNFGIRLEIPRLLVFTDDKLSRMSE